MIALSFPTLIHYFLTNEFYIIQIELNQIWDKSLQLCHAILIDFWVRICERLEILYVNFGMMVILRKQQWLIINALVG